MRRCAAPSAISERARSSGLADRCRMSADSVSSAIASARGAHIPAARNATPIVRVVPVPFATTRSADARRDASSVRPSCAAMTAAGDRHEMKPGLVRPIASRVAPASVYSAYAFAGSARSAARRARASRTRQPPIGSTASSPVSAAAAASVLTQIDQDVGKVAVDPCVVEAPVVAVAGSDRPVRVSARTEQVSAPVRHHR